MLNNLYLRRGLWACLVALLHSQTSFAITFFEGSIEEAQQKSKQENKRLLIYFTAKWCGPCRYMEKNVFHTDSVTRITDAQFVSFKVDYDAWKAKSVVDKYRVASLPTFIIVDSLEAVDKRAFGRLAVSEFVNFLTLPAVKSLERPINELRSDENRYTQRRIENAKWKPEIGIQAGVNLTQVSNLASNYKLGYEISLLLILTKNRMSIRPGIGLVSIGGKLTDGQSLRLQYVVLPVNLSYLLRKTVLIGLPGGYRVNLNPYISKLIIRPDQPLNTLDYGAKFGFSAFVGDMSRLEAQLGYQIGAKDIGQTTKSSLYNRGMYFCVAFIL